MNKLMQYDIVNSYVVFSDLMEKIVFKIEELPLY